MTATSVPLAVKAVIGTAWVLNDGKTYVRQTHDGRLVCINSACKGPAAQSCEHVRVVNDYIDAHTIDPYDREPFPGPTGGIHSSRRGSD